jgi:hypothetical protein
MKGLGLSSVSEDPWDKLKRIEKRQRQEEERERSNQPARQRRPRKYTPEEEAQYEQMKKREAVVARFKDREHMHGKAAKGRSSYANSRAMEGRPIREDETWKYRREMEEIDRARPERSFDEKSNMASEERWSSESYDSLIKKGYDRREASEMLDRARRGLTR